MSENKTHELKTDSDVFQSVIAGHKKFEIRFNDREFKVGDWLHLLETVSTGAEMAGGALLEYTGGAHLAVVTHLLSGPIYGLKEGWVIMSIEPVPSDFSPDDDEIATLRAQLADAVAFVRKAGHLPGCAAGLDSCQFSAGERAMKCGAIKGAWWHNRDHPHFGHNFQPGTCTCGHDPIVRSEGT